MSENKNVPTEETAPKQTLKERLFTKTPPAEGEKPKTNRLKLLAIGVGGAVVGAALMAAAGRASEDETTEFDVSSETPSES